MDQGSHRLLFENSIKSFNRLSRKNGPKYARQTIINLLQEPLKAFLFGGGFDFYKIFQKRAILDFELSGSDIISLKFLPKDERSSTYESCLRLNRIFASLDYAFLSSLSGDSQIESFNCFLNTKPTDKKEKSPETNFNLTLNEIQNLNFN